MLALFSTADRPADFAALLEVNVCERRDCTLHGRAVQSEVAGATTRRRFVFKGGKDKGGWILFFIFRQTVWLSYACFLLLPMQLCEPGSHHHKVPSPPVWRLHTSQILAHMFYSLHLFLYL